MHCRKYGSLSSKALWGRRSVGATMIQRLPQLRNIIARVKMVPSVRPGRPTRPCATFAAPDRTVDVLWLRSVVVCAWQCGFTRSACLSSGSSMVGECSSVRTVSGGEGGNDVCGCAREPVGCPNIHAPHMHECEYRWTAQTCTSSCLASV